MTNNKSYNFINASPRRYQKSGLTKPKFKIQDKKEYKNGEDKRHCWKKYRVWFLEKYYSENKRSEICLLSSWFWLSSQNSYLKTLDSETRVRLFQNYIFFPSELTFTQNLYFFLKILTLILEFRLFFSLNFDQNLAILT